MLPDLLSPLPPLLNLLGAPPPGILTPWIAAIALCIGSFLNVVIYRGSAKYIPGEDQTLSLSYPKGSFCPSCKTPLRWYHNIPLISYLCLGGKCAYCKTPIPAQYPIVEAITCLLLTALWVLSPSLADMLAFSFLSVALICSTGIDIKTLMIPNTITGFGIASLLILSPTTSLGMGVTLLGALAGGGVTYLCVELGKLLFGKKTVTLSQPKQILWEGDLTKPETCHLTIEDDGKTLEQSEKIPYDEIFSRPKDYITIQGELTLQDGAGNTTTSPEVKITPDGILLKNNSRTSQPCRIHGLVSSFTLPREAMGMGDVKLMALVGTGLGAMGAIHALSLAAGLGALYGISQKIEAKLRHREEPGNVIAFGPWISVAAIIILLYTLVVQP